MQTQEETLKKVMDKYDFSVRKWFESHMIEVWENGFVHGRELGIQIGKDCVRNKLDVIDEIKQGEYNRGLADGTALITDDTAIKALHRSGWMQEHDEEIFRHGRLTQEQEDIEKLKNIQANHRLELEAIKKREFTGGLNTAWANARKLTHPSNGGLFPDQKKMIFGSEDSDTILHKFTATEVNDMLTAAYAKMNEQEEPQKPSQSELSVGECVFDPSGNLCVITQIGTAIHVMYPNGKTHKWSRKTKFTASNSKVKFHMFLTHFAKEAAEGEKV